MEDGIRFVEAGTKMNLSKGFRVFILFFIDVDAYGLVFIHIELNWIN